MDTIISVFLTILSSGWRETSTLLRKQRYNKTFETIPYEEIDKFIWLMESDHRVRMHGGPKEPIALKLEELKRKMDTHQLTDIELNKNDILEMVEAIKRVDNYSRLDGYSKEGVLAYFEGLIMFDDK